MSNKGNVVKVDTNALNLLWSFGFSTTTPGAALSLVTKDRNATFYISSHTGVIHDTVHDQQLLLQGHCNPITAACVSRDKRWIATADSGDDNMIVVWDSVKACPVKIFQNPVKGGIAAMDISTDSQFLVTLSQSYPQQIAIWEWTSKRKDALVLSVVEGDEYQHCVRFNPVDVRDIVSNGVSKVIFWTWNQDSLTPFHPPKVPASSKIGHMTQTVFVPYTTKAITATSNGSMVLWDYPVSELVQSAGRDAVKILKIVSTGGINVIDTILDRYLVAGCTDGAVRFYDFQLRVVAWFEEIHAGEITSISFAEKSTMDAANAQGAHGKSDKNSNEFVVPDLIVSTAKGKIIRLESKAMDSVSEEKRRGLLLVQGFDGDVLALDAHPLLPMFCAGTSVGNLQIWDLDERAIGFSRKFEWSGLQDPNADRKRRKKQEEVDPRSTCIQCLKYAPSGEVIAVGFANGAVHIVSALEEEHPNNKVHQQQIFEQTSTDVPWSPLRDIQAFQSSTDAILKMAFSPCGTYLATADAEHMISLYKFTNRDEEAGKVMEWVFIGKNKAHYKTIVGLTMEMGPIDINQPPASVEDKAAIKRGKDREANAVAGLITDGKAAVSDKDKAQGQGEEKQGSSSAEPVDRTAYRGKVPRLFSIGEDRLLNEFDMVNASIRNGLQTLIKCDCDQSAVPSAFLMIPGHASVFKGQRGNDDGSSDKGDDVGGAKPGKAVMDNYQVGDFVIHPDTIVTCNDEYKMKLFHVQPRASESAEHLKNKKNAKKQPLAGLSKHLMAANAAAAAMPSTLSNVFGGRSNLGTAGGVGGENVERSYWWLSAMEVGKKERLFLSKKGGFNSLQLETGTSKGKLGQLSSAALALTTGSDEKGTVSVNKYMVGKDQEPFRNAREVWQDSLANHAQTAAKGAAGEAGAEGGAAKGEGGAGADNSAVVAVDEEDDPNIVLLKRKQNALPDMFCRKTSLAPTYGGPINNIFVLPRREGKDIVSSPYLVYSCKDKLVGLIRMPLTGSPSQSLALIAHPGPISIITTSFDGRYLLTAGGADRTINLWSIHTPALDANIALGGRGVTPFMSLIEGGAGGKFHEDMIDYFYFAQLRAQGLNTTKPREISGRVSMEECVNIMRALGHYPSEEEVLQMKDEIRWDHVGTSGAYSSGGVGLDDFIKMYINCRPVFGLKKNQFDEVFAVLNNLLYRPKKDKQSVAGGAKKQKDKTLKKEDLELLLAQYGEKMHPSELKLLLHTLVGAPNSAIEASKESIRRDEEKKRGMNPFIHKIRSQTAFSGVSNVSKLKVVRPDAPPSERIGDYLPSRVNASRFAQDVLGFADYGKENDGEDGN